MLALVRFGNGPPINPTEVIAALALNLLFIPAAGQSLGGDLFPLNVPAWSLVFEMAINIAYATLFVLLTNRILLAIVCASSVALVYCAIHFGSLAGGQDWSTIWVGLTRVLFSFPLGVLIYRWRYGLPDLGRLGFLMLPALLLALWAEPSAARDILFVLLVSPALLLIGAAAVPLWQPITTYLAATSYCLHVIHYPILMLVSGISNRLGISSIGPLATSVAMLLVLCFFLDRYYDRPLRRWLNSPR